MKWKKERALGEICGGKSDAIIKEEKKNNNIISNKKCFYEIQYYLYHPDDI